MVIAVFTGKEGHWGAKKLWTCPQVTHLRSTRTGSRQWAFLMPMALHALLVLLQTWAPLPSKQLVGERRGSHIHRKWGNRHGSEGVHSVLGSCKQLPYKSADPVGNEPNKNFKTSDTFPNPCPISLPTGQPLPTQGWPSGVGSPEENHYWVSYLESARLLRCFGKWQSTCTLHLPPPEGRE